MNHGRHRLFDAKRRDGRMVYMGLTGKFITRWRGKIVLRNGGLTFGPALTWDTIGGDQ